MAGTNDFGATGIILRDIIFSPTTGGIKGTTTNDDPDAGDVGETVETKQTAGITAAASGSFKEIVNIASIPAGSWDLSCLVMFEGQGGATSFTALGNFEIVIGTTTASTAGATFGYDYIRQTAETTSTAAYRTLIIPRRLTKLASPTTFYLNAACTYTSTAPKIYGYLNGRRMR